MTVPCAVPETEGDGSMRRISLEELVKEWKFGIDARDAGFIWRRVKDSSVERDLRDLLDALQDRDLKAIVRWKKGPEARVKDADADDLSESAQKLAERFDSVWRFWTKLRRDLIARGRRRR